MTSMRTVERQAEIRVLDNAEVDSVAGGYMPAIDVSGMPDRAVGGCGTMWLERKMFRLPRWQ